MMRLRPASVIATLSLLAWAATASAECSWVLWSSFMRSARAEEGEIVWSPISAGSKEDICERLARRSNEEAKQDPLAEKLQRYYVCLPDTVDPRGPKGK